jgi:hypothetical protein
VWLLAHQLGVPGGLPLLLLSTGAFAGAWSIGFLLVIAPAGAGAREAALILLLGSGMSGPQATVVAVVSRLLMTRRRPRLGRRGCGRRPQARAARRPAPSWLLGSWAMATSQTRTLRAAAGERPSPAKGSALSAGEAVVLGATLGVALLAWAGLALAQAGRYQLMPRRAGTSSCRRSRWPCSP